MGPVILPQLGLYLLDEKVTGDADAAFRARPVPAHETPPVVLSGPPTTWGMEIDDDALTRVSLKVEFPHV
jgi:hypothetical protein